MIRHTNLAELLRWTKAQGWKVGIDFGPLGVEGDDKIIFTDRRGVEFTAIATVDPWKDYVDIASYLIRDVSSSLMLKIFDPEFHSFMFGGERCAR